MSLYAFPGGFELFVLLYLYHSGSWFISDDAKARSGTACLRDEPYRVPSLPPTSSPRQSSWLYNSASIFVHQAIPVLCHNLHYQYEPLQDDVTWQGTAQHERQAVLKAHQRRPCRSRERGRRSQRRVHREHFPVHTKPDRWVLVSTVSAQGGPALTRLARLLAHRARAGVALLHAAAPADMFVPLQHLVSARRARRIRGAALPAKHKVRRRARHGDGPLHDQLSARVPRERVPALEHRLPGPDQPRSREPLHAHVRDAQHGRQRAEPQEDRERQRRRQDGAELLLRQHGESAFVVLQQSHRQSD